MIRLTAIRFTRAGADDRGTGIEGWVRLTVPGLMHLDGIAVRRTARGRLALVFPARKKRHPYFWPTDRGVREEIRRQILEAIAAELGAVR